VHTCARRQPTGAGTEHSQFRVLYQSSYAIAGDAGVFWINDRLCLALPNFIVIFIVEK